MLHKGPISRAVHGLLEYLAGALLVASPFLFGFDTGKAKAVAVVMGVAVIALAAATAGPPGLIDQIALPTHAVLDYVVAAILIASPFLFGFTADSAPTALLIVLGVVYLLISIATRYLPARTEGDRHLGGRLPGSRRRI
jgi:hypothetical protein